jgi:hypothetical protein
VALHEVSAAVEMADGTLAVSRAQEAERAGYPARLPPVRTVHYQVELARAWLYHGNRQPQGQLSMFLAGHTSWEISFFSSWFWPRQPDLVPQPLAGENSGSIWLPTVR